ncbi:hypothetical protein [uncultured Thiodictyon sp.]|jgi:DNA-binding transcriptional LysR family regulator|uniref:hypothetical protein n=1 Tax=uncultured Thiodictyon sp. TaxID=1846217 RepID=UPI0025D9CCF3|nr:hypothetical protein [uncultured Thiodictyon sp.]
MIKFQQLAHALALSRYGTFHRAAKAQHLSQREIELLQGLETRHFAVAVGAYAGELSANRAVADLIARAPDLRVKVELSTWHRSWSRPARLAWFRAGVCWTRTPAT